MKITNNTNYAAYPAYSNNRTNKAQPPSFGAFKAKTPEGLEYMVNLFAKNMVEFKNAFLRHKDFIYTDVLFDAKGAEIVPKPGYKIQQSTDMKLYLFDPATSTFCRNDDTAKLGKPKNYVHVFDEHTLHYPFEGPHSHRISNLDSAKQAEKNLLRFGEEHTHDAAAIDIAEDLEATAVKTKAEAQY